MTFDLCVFPYQFETVLALVDHCPDVRFILDHCANPPIKDGMNDVWRNGIGEFSRRPNVTAKISGVIAYGDLENWSVDSLRPYVEHTIERFGWDRVVWGSDWPVCTLGGGLTPWVAATHALTSGCSAQERDKLYQANASTHLADREGERGRHHFKSLRSRPPRRRPSTKALFTAPTRRGWMSVTARDEGGEEPRQTERPPSAKKKQGSAIGTALLVHPMLESL